MYEDMIRFVDNYFKKAADSGSSSVEKYPFRNRFDHCMRVYKWAVRINEIERGHNDIVSISAIFHDIGKAHVNDKSHGEVGAAICNSYLSGINFDENLKNKIVHAISIHNYKEDHCINLTLEEKILMDADLLDEVGALTVVWDSMATAIEPDPEYSKVFLRTSRYYEKLKGKSIYLKTDYGRKLYSERLNFLHILIDNLKFELGI